MPVREELENLNNYIRILQARFGGKICFEIDAAPDTLSCEIIKVCLQPLIENSVSHGLVQKGGRGRIFIRIRRREGLLEIVEEDDGTGMDDATPGPGAGAFAAGSRTAGRRGAPPANGRTAGWGCRTSTSASACITARNTAFFEQRAGQRHPRDHYGTGD